MSLLSLCKNTQKSFFTKNAHPCSNNNKTSQKHTHAKEDDVFHFDSLRFADDGFCAQKDRRELARVQVRANDVSLSLRVNFVSFFFSFFFNIFSPLREWTPGRGRSALDVWTLSLVWGVHREWGSIGPIAKDESGREGGGLCCCCCFLVGRTLLLGVVSKEAGVLIPSSLTIIHDLSSFRIQKMDIF